MSTMPKPPPEQVLQTTSRELPVRITDDEIREDGRELARLQAVLSDLESAKRDALLEWKRKIDSVKQQQQQIGQRVRDGVVLRQVECRIVGFFDENLTRVYRLDTNEQIEERAMQPAERQGLLFRAGPDADLPPHAQGDLVAVANEIAAAREPGDGDGDDLPPEPVADLWGDDDEPEIADEALDEQPPAGDDLEPEIADDEQPEPTTKRRRGGRAAAGKHL